METVQQGIFRSHIIHKVLGPGGFASIDYAAEIAREGILRREFLQCSLGHFIIDLGIHREAEHHLVAWRGGTYTLEHPAGFRPFRSSLSPFVISAQTEGKSPDHTVVFIFRKYVGQLSRLREVIGHHIHNKLVCDHGFGIHQIVSRAVHPHHTEIGGVGLEVYVTAQQGCVADSPADF